jgi:dTMP kinase
MTSKARALVICVDGADGTGKTTIINKLIGQLDSLGINSFSTKEPFDDGLSINLVRHLMHEYVIAEEITEKNELNRQLILALTLNRRMHIKKVWESVWEDDIDVIVLDRFVWSTLVYQGILNDPEADVELIDDLSDEFVYPDLNFIIRTTPENQQKRLSSRGKDEFDTFASQALIAYDNLIVDINRAGMYTYTKGYAIKKRAQLIPINNDEDTCDKAVSSIVELIQQKLQFAKYNKKGKGIEEEVVDEE